MVSKFGGLLTNLRNTYNTKLLNSYYNYFVHMEKSRPDRRHGVLTMLKATNGTNSQEKEARIDFKITKKTRNYKC